MYAAIWAAGLTKLVYMRCLQANFHIYNVVSNFPCNTLTHGLDTG